MFLLNLSIVLIAVAGHGRAGGDLRSSVTTRKEPHSDSVNCVHSPDGGPVEFPRSANSVHLVSL